MSIPGDRDESQPTAPDENAAGRAPGTDGTGEARDEITSLPALAGIPWARVGSQVVLHPSRERYLEVAEALEAAGFEMCADLCGVDYLADMGRLLPDGIEPERFEVVVSLVSIGRRERVRLRVQVPESDPTAPTLFFVYPGSEAMEREAFDMFGISFDHNPDMTRILMPEDWEGHPLRKDYSVGRVPVQFKEAPGPR